MLVAAAVAPHPPLLIPEVGSGAAAELDDLRSAAVDAVRDLVRSRPDLLVVVGGAAAAAAFGAGAAGTMSGFGVDLRTQLPGDAVVSPGEPVVDSTRLPLSLTVGAWLLTQAEWSGSVEGHAIAD
ncbi:MAG TPA: hypothetical protein VMT27_09385, partial [Actinomycetes bacterium]|nr:hypothetical protein [Actinomycetes bacterium]